MNLLGKLFSQKSVLFFSILFSAYCRSQQLDMSIFATVICKHWKIAFLQLRKRSSRSRKKVSQRTLHRSLFKNLPLYLGGANTKPCFFKAREGSDCSATTTSCPDKKQNPSRAFFISDYGPQPICFPREGLSLFIPNERNRRAASSSCTDEHS